MIVFTELSIIKLLSGFWLLSSYWTYIHEQNNLHLVSLEETKTSNK